VRARCNPTDLPGDDHYTDALWKVRNILGTGLRPGKTGVAYATKTLYQLSSCQCNLTNAPHYTQVEAHWILALEGPYRDALYSATFDASLRGTWVLGPLPVRNLRPPPAYTGGREYLTPSPTSPGLIRVAYVGPVPLGFLP
jgi:hypothetical protein